MRVDSILDVLRHVWKCVFLLYAGVNDKWWRGWGLIKTPRRPWETIYREAGFAEVKSSSIFQRKFFHLSENGHLGKPLLTPLVCQDWELLPVLFQGRTLAEFSLPGYLLSTPVAGEMWYPLLNKAFSNWVLDWRLPANLQEPLHLSGGSFPLLPSLPSSLSPYPTAFALATQ